MIKQSEKEALFCIFAFFIFHIEARSALHRVLHQPTKRERGLRTARTQPRKAETNHSVNINNPIIHTNTRYSTVRRLALAPAASCFALAPAANTHRHTDRLSPNPQKTRSRGRRSASLESLRILHWSSSGSVSDINRAFCPRWTVSTDVKVSFAIIFRSSQCPGPLCLISCAMPDHAPLPLCGEVQTAKRIPRWIENQRALIPRIGANTGRGHKPPFF